MINKYRLASFPRGQMSVSSFCRSSDSPRSNRLPTKWQWQQIEWNNLVELTAAGLYRNLTCFPFNPRPRKKPYEEQDAAKIIQAECNTKKASFFLLPRRSLSYQKIVQAAVYKKMRQPPNEDYRNYCIEK